SEPVIHPSAQRGQAGGREKPSQPALTRRLLPQGRKGVGTDVEIALIILDIELAPYMIDGNAAYSQGVGMRHDIAPFDPVADAGRPHPFALAGNASAAHRTSAVEIDAAGSHGVDCILSTLALLLLSSPGLPPPFAEPKRLRLGASGRQSPGIHGP